LKFVPVPKEIEESIKKEKETKKETEQPAPVEAKKPV